MTDDEFKSLAGKYGKHKLPPKEPAPETEPIDNLITPIEAYATPKVYKTIDKPYQAEPPENKEIEHQMSSYQERHLNSEQLLWDALHQAYDKLILNFKNSTVKYLFALVLGLIGILISYQGISFAISYFEDIKEEKALQAKIEEEKENQSSSRQNSFYDPTSVPDYMK